MSEQPYSEVVDLLVGYWRRTGPADLSTQDACRQLAEIVARSIASDAKQYMVAGPWRRAEIEAALGALVESSPEVRSLIHYLTSASLASVNQRPSTAGSRPAASQKAVYSGNGGVVIMAGGNVSNVAVGSPVPAHDSTRRQTISEVPRPRTPEPRWAAPRTRPQPEPPSENRPEDRILPSAAPADLEIRVRVKHHNGQMQLSYTLHSPLEVLGLFHKDIAGPTLMCRPEAFQADLVQKIEKLSDGLDLDDEMLLKKEIERRFAGIGRKLYHDLFPEELRLAYRKFRSKVCTVQITTDEPWIPWELVKPYDDGDRDAIVDDDFLCLRFQLTRWLAGGKPAAGEIRVGKLACINAGSVPGLAPLPSAQDEHKLLAHLAIDHPGIEDASPHVASSEELEKLLEEGGVGLLHVVAHGDFDLARPDAASFLLVDKRSFRTDDLHGPLATRIAQDRPLVFLNACRTGQQGWSLTGLGGWARAWIDCRCGAFVGPQWAVRDDLTYEFARVFYGALEGGKTFGQASQEARTHAKNLDASCPTWLALAVYAHPNGRLLL